MSYFSLKNLSDTYKSGNKYNYLGEYNPDKFWNEYGEVYIDTFEPNSKKEACKIELNMDHLVSRIYILKPEKVLEVGCGFGRCFPFILKNVKCVKVLKGIELSESMIRRSKDYEKACEDKYKFDIIQGNAEALPFKDKSFDLIYTHVCLTHIPPKDILGVTNEISRVAKNWIIHAERFRFLHEHPHQHRWSHDLASLYLKLGWEIHEYQVLNKEHHTIILVLKRS